MMVQRALKRHSPSDLVRLAIARGKGLATQHRRTVADFIIIGAQRCGTTSMMRYLAQHPGFHPSQPKETHYFSLYYSRGLAWYQSHFPLSSLRDRAGSGEHGFAAGEATPYYLLHPLAPERVAKTVPNIKLILLLRDPVDRAYSHYQFEVEMGVETLSFEDALAEEEARTAGEEARIRADPAYRSFNHQHFTYLARGRYAEQITRWLGTFSKDQVLIIESEDFFRDPSTVMMRVTAFVELPSWTYEGFKPYNGTQYQRMEPRLRQELCAYFRPYNRDLNSLVGCGTKWGQ